jgi:hypothetical protein
LTSSKGPSGVEARAIPAPAQQDPATYVRTAGATAVRPCPAVPAYRPGGHDWRRTRPLLDMHCPPGNSFPAELAVTIQDGPRS